MLLGSVCLIRPIRRFRFPGSDTDHGKRQQTQRWATWKTDGLLGSHRIGDGMNVETGLSSL